jgi:hypothetical protein
MAAPVENLDQLLVTARRFADYVAMFRLTPEDLALGPILDCPGGVASFGAEARALGAAVVGVDPVYAQPRDALVAHAESELARNMRFVAGHAERFRWDQVGSIEEHEARRRDGLERFAADYRHGGRSYVAASLPTLPFADDAFALALSSHLLFSYSDRLDRDFHLASLFELVRVTAGEVRCFPLVDLWARRYHALEELRERLAHAGVDSEIREADYEFQRGGREMLVCSRA